MKISLHFSAVISLSLAVLLFDPALLAAILFCAAMHEFAHILAIRLFGGRVLKLEILSGGCIIEKSPACMRPDAELAVYAAGPVMNLALWGIFSAFSGGFFSLLSEISLSLAVFNLLPLRSQDGGCMLRVLTFRFLPLKAAQTFCEICSFFVLGTFFVLGIRMLLFYDFSSVYFWFCVSTFYTFYVRSDNFFAS